MGHAASTGVSGSEDGSSAAAQTFGTECCHQLQENCSKMTIRSTCAMNTCTHSTFQEYIIITLARIIIMHIATIGYTVIHYLHSVCIVTQSVILNVE